LLAPSAGVAAAEKKALWLVAPGDLDKRLLAETNLHQTLRARDRIHEFAWHRAELAATAKAFKKDAETIYEVMGKSRQILTVLQERARLRTFLMNPVTAGDMLARSTAQTLLTPLDATVATFATSLTVKATQPEVITRRVTPQLYWVTPYPNIPQAGGSQQEGGLRGNPGDVVVIVRPFGGENVEGEKP
jgi:hypothetical protein